MQELVSSSGFRGLAMDEISPDLCMEIGLALSGAASGPYVVGHDTRLSSPLLKQALITGLNEGGSDAVDLGLMPTPAVAFYSLGRAGGAMVTASHNPPQYNGIKLFNGRGASLSQAGYLSLISGTGSPGLARWDSLGTPRSGEGLHGYIEHLASSAKIRRSWRVGLDPGNGATTITAPMALSLCGASPSAINLAPDGTFPGRGAEPEGAALSSLCQLVRENGLDVGFAFDGDGDRVAVVDENGSPVPQDLALGFVAARSVRSRGGSRVIVNVDASAVVDLMVESEGGKVQRCRVGDAYVLEALMAAGGVFGGEACGAWIHPELSLCPDGVLSSIVFLNLLEESGLKPSQIGRGLPRLHLRRRKIPFTNELKQHVMGPAKVLLTGMFPDAAVTDVDGIRIELADKSWVLVRPSGTEPLIRITAESSSEVKADELAARVSEAVGSLKVGSQ
jgi:phosphoglucosamine mutase